MSTKPQAILSGPMFYDPKGLAESSICKNGLNKSMGCFRPKSGGHYNHYFVYARTAMEHLRKVFPTGEANELNFVLFSTSGVHGTYATIEDSEEDGGDVTFVIIQPRLCTIHYGTCEPKTKEDYSFLKKLRQSSWDVVQTIGKP